MRKIDKSKILSVDYKKWVDELDKKKLVHPKASRTTYIDIVMNLLHCQKGLCAYTEMRLCKPGHLTEDNWENGCYKGRNPKRFGELEHFNPDLKKAKYCEWSNLFVAASDINRRKGKQEVDDILKPDSPNYDPYELLEYDTETHFFVPNQGIENEEIRTRVDRMIDILQLNHDTVYTEREEYLTNARECLELKGKFNVSKFFTACKMAGISVEDDR